MILIKEMVKVYNGFFKMAKITFDQKRFDGSVMKNVVREVFLRNPVVFLSLYDPKTDLHLFVKQIRVGAVADNKALSPLVLEPIAGIIENDEDPIETAIREAKEEAGIDVDVESLKIVQKGYVSPGGSNEFAYFITGKFDSTTYTPQIGGVEGEQEDVQSLLINTPDALTQIEEGTINSLSAAFGICWHVAHSRN